MMPDPLASRMVPDPLLDSSNERLRLVAWSVVGGIAYGLVQPGGPASGPAALVAIAPLLHAMSRQAWPARLVAGWLTGSLAAAIACGETAWTGLGAYFALDGLVLAGAWLLAHQLLGALPFVVFAGLAGDPASGSSARSALRVAGAWVLGELAREALLPGAWLSLASALTSAPRLLDSAALESPRVCSTARRSRSPRVCSTAPPSSAHSAFRPGSPRARCSPCALSPVPIEGAPPSPRASSRPSSSRRPSGRDCSRRPTVPRS